MEFLKQVIARVKTLQTFSSSFTTRQRILAIICCIFVVDVFLLPFGLTLIFICGTALGLWCSSQLWKRPAVFKWENALSFLPHIAKQRPLFQIENGQGDDQEGKTLSTLNEAHSPALSRQSILQTEMSEYVRLMMRDFVVGWYRVLSDDDQFSHNVFHHFKDMIKNIKHRFAKIDQKVFLCTLLHELRAHVDIFRRLQMSLSRLASKSSKLGRSAKKHSVVSIYETFAILHPALQNEEVEKEHLSELCNTLILSLLPSDVITCDTLVFLLKDILINNVFQPLVHLISDPDFLNEAFILLLMDEPLGQESHDHRNADTKPHSKEEHAPTNESEHPSKQGEDLERDFDKSNPDMDQPGMDTSSVHKESREDSENHLAEKSTVKSCISNKQETVHSVQNPSHNEIGNVTEMDETESVQEKVPSPSEITEPPQQFSFVMPMTMLEPSKAILTQDAETVSKEESQDDETNEQMKTPSLGPTVKVKTHRRSASTGSNIIAFQTAGVIDGVNENVATHDLALSSRLEGTCMRSCFSTNCLDDITSTPTVSSLRTESGPSYQSTSSLSTCSSSEVSSSVPFSSKIDGQEQQETDGHQIDAMESSTSQGASPRHRNLLLRSETAPALLTQTPPDTYDLHPTTGGDIPMEWATWRVTNLFIPTTSWLGDPKGKKPVVYFVIKYDLLKKPTLSDSSDATYSSQNVMEVRRRYREFVNLHTRITNNVHLRRNMRGIGNIPKQSMLPLTRLSPAMEEQKKTSLETYLKQLLSRPVIHNSREMAEFLAIDGDGHIEFVKKASNRPLRIDKLLIHQVSGIVGTIKTILPERSPLMKPASHQTSSSAPGPAVVGQPSRKMQSNDQNRPMTEERLVAAREQPIGGEDQWDFGGVVDTSRVRLFGLDEMKESHMQRVMKLLVSQKHEQFAQDTPSSPSPGEYDKVFLGTRSEGDGSDAPNEPHREKGPIQSKAEMVRNGSVEVAPKDNVEVYEAIFGVMSEALLNQQSFILDQNLQGSLTILIGDLVDKWLFREIGLLFTEAQWGYYLSLLRELLWPGGVWSPKDRETKTADEMAQTKSDALHELTHNAAAAVLSVILGEEHLRDGISLVLDSLQDQDLNKHLLFTFLDHAMDQLVPEIHDAKFQDSLAGMP